MTKTLAILFTLASLAACSSMYGNGSTQPNSGATQNSTDANHSRNPAAVSPGGGASGGASGAGASGSGSAGGAR
jgi:hypothetical protein